MLRVLPLVILAAAVSAQRAPLAESWQGTLQTGAARMRLGLHFRATPAGEYFATLDSIDQGVSAIPVQVARVSGNSVHLELRSIGAVYEGTLTDDGSEIRGTFTQGIAVPLIFDRVEKIVELNRPQ